MINLPASLTPRPANLGASKLQPAVESLAAKQIVTDMTSRPMVNSSVTPINPGQVASIIPIPPKLTVTVTNGNSSGAGLASAKFLNNADFTALPSNWTVTYSDGFSGKLMTNLMKGLGGASGLFIFGFNVTGYDSDGAKSDSVINNSGIQALYYTGNGSNYIPVDLNIAGAERNTQFKDGLLTVKTEFVLNMLSQMTCSLDDGESLQFVFFTQPILD